MANRKGVWPWIETTGRNKITEQLMMVSLKQELTDRVAGALGRFG
jgi:hypothetical protein